MPSKRQSLVWVCGVGLIFLGAHGLWGLDGAALSVGTVFVAYCLVVLATREKPDSDVPERKYPMIIEL